MGLALLFNWEQCCVNDYYCHQVIGVGFLYLPSLDMITVKKVKLVKVIPPTCFICLLNT